MFNVMLFTIGFGNPRFSLLTGLEVDDFATSLTLEITGTHISLQEELISSDIASHGSFTDARVTSQADHRLDGFLAGSECLDILLSPDVEHFPERELESDVRNSDQPR